jgi:predicted transcriptional regulator
MSKKQLKPEERKIKFSISIDRELFKIVNLRFSNKSKYIQKLIEQDINKEDYGKIQ